MPTFPARLHVLLAREVPLGVVIRRGPSKAVCTLLWDRRTDEFTLGQWMRGRIYERRSDLSPDGKHLIYFAMNGKWDNETGGAWTAISKAPYLKALTLYGKGDCWNGGGLFIDDRQFWLNDGGFPHTPLREEAVVRRSSTSQPYQDYHGECPGIYYQRLGRDGWQPVDDHQRRALRCFEKAVNKSWTLRKYAHAEMTTEKGKGSYRDGHQLIHGPTGTTIPGDDWEWADVDRKRVVWAKGGKLHSAKLGQTASFEEQILHDFNGMMFEAIEAPY